MSARSFPRCRETVGTLDHLLCVLKRRTGRTRTRALTPSQLVNVEAVRLFGRKPHHPLEGHQFQKKNTHTTHLALVAPETRDFEFPDDERTEGESQSSRAPYPTRRRTARHQSHNTCGRRTSRIFFRASQTREGFRPRDRNLRPAFRHASLFRERTRTSDSRFM